MMRLIRFLLLVCLMAFGISGLSAQATYSFYDQQAVLMQYIGALNQKDYQTAYNIYHPETQTYANFVQGYATTQRIVPYFGFTGAAAGTSYVTTVLLGYQTDGTVNSYYGVYMVVSGQMYDPPRNNGRDIIVGAEFKLVKQGKALHNTSIQTLLSGVFDRTRAIPEDLPHLSAMSNVYTDALLNYYDLINQGRYDVAYGRWLSPVNGLSKDYRLPYAQFAAGYGDTAYVTVYAGDVQAVPQSPYLAGYVPAVLVSQHTDGTFSTYSGCYALGRFADGSLGIVNGKFRWLGDGAPETSVVFGELNSLFCSSLGMGV